MAKVKADNFREVDCVKRLTDKAKTFPPAETIMGLSLYQPEQVGDRR